MSLLLYQADCRPLGPKPLPVPKSLIARPMHRFPHTSPVGMLHLGHLQHGNLGIPSSRGHSMLQSLVTFPLIPTQSRSGNGPSLGLRFNKVCLCVDLFRECAVLMFCFFLQILALDWDDYWAVKLNVFPLKGIKKQTLILCIAFLCVDGEICRLYKQDICCPCTASTRENYN